MASRSLRRLRRQRLLHRVLICALAVGLIAAAAAGLVWLLENLRTYNPTYYEPKDIERERYELQRRPTDAESGPRRP